MKDNTEDRVTITEEITHRFHFELDKDTFVALKNMIGSSCQSLRMRQLHLSKRQSDLVEKLFYDMDASCRKAKLLL